ncbi:MAG TPA: hypothetical protein VIS99_17135, partial [Terrimicrobiaceae bacterium]
MATLDRVAQVPAYKVELKFHSSRPPSGMMARKICESLQLARGIATEGLEKLELTLNDPQHQNACPPALRVALQAARYHFQVDPGSPQKDQIFSVLRDTAEGLNEQLTLSDVLNEYTYDSYKVYRDGLSEDEARIDWAGDYRERMETRPVE